MIKFILPQSFDNVVKNQTLIRENNYDNLFWGISTDLPFSIFNGKINNNINSNFIDYYTIKEILESYQEISENYAVFDFSSISVEEKDYENCFGAVVFEEYANKQNIYFELSDINFIDFLIKRYPNIQIILSENFTIFHTENEIQQVIDNYNKNILMINITFLNLCKNINIEKIGVLNLDSCFYCPQFPLCLNKEHKNILRFRRQSIFNDCDKKKFISLDNLIDNLKTLLKETDKILFGNIAFLQIEDYFNLIHQILEAEKEGVFNQ